MADITLLGRQQLARTLWNRMGARAGGVGPGVMGRLWDAVAQLPSADARMLQQHCDECVGCGLELLLNWLAMRKPFAKIYGQCLAIRAGRIAAARLEQGGTPAVYEPFAVLAGERVGAAVASIAAKAPEAPKTATAAQCYLELERGLAPPALS